MEKEEVSGRQREAEEGGRREGKRVKHTIT